MNILLLEDDAELAGLVSKSLRRLGYGVSVASDGVVGERLVRGAGFDAAIVDLMLPGRDGLTVIGNLRRDSIKTPLIVLSAKRASADKVACLKEGADDYLQKPFDLPELEARLEAVLRRSHEIPASDKLELSGVSLDLVGRVVRRDGQALALPPREFALLELLMRNAGRPLSKSYLLERLWGVLVDPQTNVVDVLVCRLRERVDRDHAVKLIQTVRGIGYVFRPV